MLSHIEAQERYALNTVTFSCQYSDLDALLVFLSVWIPWFNIFQNARHFRQPRRLIINIRNEWRLITTKARVAFVPSARDSLFKSTFVWPFLKAKGKLDVLKWRLCRLEATDRKCGLTKIDATFI